MRRRREADHLRYDIFLDYMFSLQTLHFIIRGFVQRVGHQTFFDNIFWLGEGVIFPSSECVSNKRLKHSELFANNNYNISRSNMCWVTAML